ncbi:MAG: TonB-dependent receptor [Opitutaceae bacterium]
MPPDPHSQQLLTTNRKALVINLDARRYGTFAEIGAGQEVARHFFQAGGASGTIAKTMSAYDMEFSDAIYGRSKRYVSEARLSTMLDHEYELLDDRLVSSRGANTRFFVFADTVAARSYRGDNECHGWLGVRFQIEPGEPPNDILVHVRLWDRENLQQQLAAGILGVNLLYGAFFLHEEPPRLVRSLIDNLSSDRIEIDVVRFEGPSFAQTSNRLLALELVQGGLTDAILYSPEGSALQPSEALYKKAVLVQRGSFHPVTRVNVDMIECASRRFLQETAVAGRNVLPLFEMSMSKLQAADAIDPRDFLDRVDSLAAAGMHVLVSNDLPYFRLTAYFRRYTSEMIGYAMGARAMAALLDEKQFEHLQGGILEAFGRLFKANVRLYVYPRLRQSADGADDELIDGSHLPVPKNLIHLHAHLLENGLIETLSDYDAGVLGIFARDALRLIQAGEPGWENMVPPAAAKVIRERRLFGFRGSLSES